MSYTALALLGVAGALVVDLAVLRTRLVLSRVFWTTYGIILFFQLITNGILTGRGVVTYDPSTIVGLRIVHAPVEDLLFGFALILLTLTVWVWQERPRYRRTSGPDGASVRPARGRGSPRT